MKKGIIFFALSMIACSMIAQTDTKKHTETHTIEQSEDKLNHEQSSMTESQIKMRRSKNGKNIKLTINHTEAQYTMKASFAEEMSGNIYAILSKKLGHGKIDKSERSSWAGDANTYTIQLNKKDMEVYVDKSKLSQESFEELHKTLEKVREYLGGSAPPPPPPPPSNAQRGHLPPPPPPPPAKEER